MKGGRGQPVQSRLPRLRRRSSSISGSMRPRTSPEAMLIFDVALPVDARRGLRYAAGTPTLIVGELPPLGRLASAGDACSGASRGAKVMGSNVRLPIVDGPELGARAVDEPVLLPSWSFLRRLPMLSKLAKNRSDIC